MGTLALTPAGALTYKATAKVTKGQFLNETLTVTGSLRAGRAGLLDCPDDEGNRRDQEGHEGHDQVVEHQRSPTKRMRSRRTVRRDLAACTDSAAN